MKKSILVSSLILFVSSVFIHLNANNIRLKTEEGYTKQGNVFIKVDSLYYNYPNPSVGDEWGNDFSEMYSFGRDSANQLFTDNGYKSVFEYDANMRELSRAYYYLDNNTWVLDLKWENTYNGQGQAVRFSRYILISNVLQENYRITQTFNTNGYLIERLEQQVSNGVTTNVNNKIYTRDANGNLTDYIYQTWNNNAWLNNSRTISTFVSGTALADTVVRYDWNNNTWRILSRDLNTYNANGLLTEKVYQVYNTNTQVFTNNKQEVQAYNANGNRALFSFYTWLNSNWRLDREITYQTYTGDFFGRLTVKQYNNTTMQMENESRIDNIFNTDGWRIRSRDYNWVNGSWEEIANRDFTFETKQATSVNENFVNAEMKAHPNPFTTNTIIEFESSENTELQLQITDLNGRVVFQKNLFAISGKNSLLWDASNVDSNELPAGTYIATIKNQYRTQTFKLLKQ